MSRRTARRLKKQLVFILVWQFWSLCVWTLTLDPSAITNLQIIASPFSHMKKRGGWDWRWGEVRWGSISETLVTEDWEDKRREVQLTQHFVCYRIMPSQLITPRPLRSVPETRHRYSKPACCLPVHHTKRRPGTEPDACAVAAQCVCDEWGVKQNEASQLLATFRTSFMRRDKDRATDLLVDEL